MGLAPGRGDDGAPALPIPGPSAPAVGPPLREQARGIRRTHPELTHTLALREAGLRRDWRAAHPGQQLPARCLLIRVEKALQASAREIGKRWALDADAAMAEAVARAVWRAEHRARHAPPGLLTDPAVPIPLRARKGSAVPGVYWLDALNAAVLRHDARRGTITRHPWTD